MQPGGVAAAWRDERRVYSIDVDDPLPFIDIEHEETRAWLQHETVDHLATLGVDSLDVAAIRGGNRLLTRALAQHIYVANDDGNPRYSGVRYLSRHGDYECWAIFDGNEVSVATAAQIDRDDADLQHVASLWNLTVHGT